MSSKPLSLKKGDFILVDNCIIGIIRHKGFVTGLSNGKYDHYVGIEIKYQSNNKTVGIPTDGTWSRQIYFNTTQDKGRFVKDHMVTKKFTPEELFDSIPNPRSLIPNLKPIPIPTPPDDKKHNKHIENKRKPIIKPAPKQTKPTSINYEKHDDIGKVAKRLHTFCTAEEIKYFIQFCTDEAFTALDDIQDDLDVFEGDDSAIIDAMKKKFSWNDTKISKIVTLALDKKVTPGFGTDDYDYKQEPADNSQRVKPPPVRQDKVESKEDDYTIQYQLALVSDFIVPIDIMRKKDERTIKDIVSVLNKNNISKDAIRQFEMFCKNEKYKFRDFETNLQEVRNKFKHKHTDLIVFMDYIEKCIYELSPPVFKGGKFTKKDEDIKHAFFEKQCPRAIKHDRDLLQYFCITENTEKELPSELIDIADRIAIDEKQELNVQQFGNKYFFKHCDKMQINKVKAGLRKYHSRLLPLFPKNPLKQVADKISGFQKYCVLLSYVVTEIEKQITSGYNRYNKDDELLIPYMIDMMIVPPGCFNKVEDANTKTYDCSGPEGIGNIKKRLNDFNIPIMETRGLTDKKKNFNLDIIEGVGKQIIGYIKKITNNYTKKNQRIVILIDRRWRIKGQKFRAYKKLREYNSISGLSNEDEGKHNKSNSFLTRGFFGGGDGKKKHDFYNNKHDKIYVYQPNLSQAGKKSYHEFGRDYCHETLIWLTKQCIIPRKDHYMHIGGDTSDGWLFNISVHIQIPNNKLWYKYDQRWYVYLQSAALRFFPSDMDKLWPKYFVDSSEDNDRLTYDQIKRMFRINLEETDASYKRWYYAIKRSD